MAGAYVLQDEAQMKKEQLSVTQVLEFEQFFKRKVNMSLSEFNWELQKKKQNFLVMAQVNSIIKKE